MKTLEPRIFRAARRHFGFYANAVVQAGIDYSTMAQQQLALQRRRCQEQSTDSAQPAGNLEKNES